MITPRPYQSQAAQAVQAAWNNGVLNALVVAATGAGKTEIGLLCVAGDSLSSQKRRVLWIAHRKELIEQPRERIIKHWPELGLPGIVMGDRNEYRAAVVIATIQTLQSPRRLEQILSAGPITHLVTDEAHHATSSSYASVYDRLRSENPTLRHLGLTATPIRTDNNGLASVFDVVAYRITIKDCIKSGYLTPMVALGISLPVSFAGVRVTGGEYDDEEAGQVLSARNAEEIIVKTWEKEALTRPTIAFTASVFQAHSLAERFREAGHSFEAIDGTMAKSAREGMIARFKRGDLCGLVNCAVLTEGFDAPEASCLIQARPTRSNLVYVQMIGRVLRTAPGKENALILDFVPQDARDLIMAGDILGKPADQKKREQQAVEEGIVSAFGLDRDGNGIDGDPDQVILNVLDYLSDSALSWYTDGKFASAALSDAETLVVTLPNQDAILRLEKANQIRRDISAWRPNWEREYQKVRRAAMYCLYRVGKNNAVPLGEFETWQEVTCAADEIAEQAGNHILAGKGRKWRLQPPTESQTALLKRIGLLDSLPRNDRGTASKVIAHYFATRFLIRKGERAYEKSENFGTIGGDQRQRIVHPPTPTGAGYPSEEQAEEQAISGRRLA